MAKKKSVCRFVVYHTHDDHLPPEERVVTREPFSQAGWSRAMRRASDVAIGIDPAFPGRGKTDTFLEIECSGQQLPLMNCTPEFGKGGCWPYTVGKDNYPSTREIAGPTRRRRRRRR